MSASRRGDRLVVLFAGADARVGAGGVMRPFAGRGASIFDGAAGAGATGGRRTAAWIAKRSAADFVRRYPAVYTASTVAELNATRLLATFLCEPLSDTAAL
jgi:hypothetical protein